MYFESAMNKMPFFKFALILLFLTNYEVNVPVFGGTTIVNTSTENIELANLITIQIDYSVKININHPDKIKKGTSSSWTVDVEGQNARITIKIDDSVPLIGGKIYNIENKISIGEDVTFPVTTGLNIILKSRLSTPINISPPGQVDIQQLEWDSETQKSFSVRVLDTAKNGERVNIEFPFLISLYASVRFDLIAFQYEIGESRLGTFHLTPIILETITVGEDLLIYLMAIMIIVPIVSVSIYLIYKKRKPSKKFCGKCGSKIDPSKKFCGKCGARIK